MKYEVVPHGKLILRPAVSYKVCETIIKPFLAYFNCESSVTPFGDQPIFSVFSFLFLFMNLFFRKRNALSSRCIVFKKFLNLVLCVVEAISFFKSYKWFMSNSSWMASLLRSVCIVEAVKVHQIEIVLSSDLFQPFTRTFFLTRTPGHCLFRQESSQV